MPIRERGHLAVFVRPRNRRTISEQEFAQAKARLLDTQARDAVDAQADRRTSIS